MVKWLNTPDFDSGIRRFESSYPFHFKIGKSYMRLFKTRPYTVWHSESPGVKVLVFRNWLQDLFLSPDFAGLSEKCYSDIHVGIDRTALPLTDD